MWVAGEIGREASEGGKEARKEVIVRSGNTKYSREDMEDASVEVGTDYSGEHGGGGDESSKRGTEESCCVFGECIAGCDSVSVSPNELVIGNSVYRLSRGVRRAQVCAGISPAPLCG